MIFCLQTLKLCITLVPTDYALCISFLPMRKRFSIWFLVKVVPIYAIVDYTDYNETVGIWHDQVNSKENSIFCLFPVQTLIFIWNIRTILSFEHLNWIEVLCVPIFTLHTYVHIVKPSYCSRIRTVVKLYSNHNRI